MKAKPEQLTAWITKYALTIGIMAKEVETCPGISDTMVTVIGNKIETYHGGDWHRTKECPGQGQENAGGQDFITEETDRPC